MNLRDQITVEQRQMVERYASMLDSLCSTIEASGNYELAIEAIPMLDSARKRLDRMQANPVAYRHHTLE